MLRKSERTMDRYMRVGAMMRLYKMLGVKLAVEASTVLSAQDQDRLHRAQMCIGGICSKAEDNMFRDHPDISNDYLNVFYGDTDDEPRSDVDRYVLRQAREVARELFAGKRD